MVIKKGNKRIGVSYPKYLMELHLSRYLLPDETVDHIDRDHTNDDLSNLQVLSRREHSKLDCKRTILQTFECFVCGNKFTLNRIQLSSAVFWRRKGSNGPYCSKSCAGKASTAKQYNQKHNQHYLQKHAITREYTTLKEMLKI